MDKRTRALFTDQIYQEALARFGIEPDSVKELGGFESFLYEYQKEGAAMYGAATNPSSAYILRISHSLHNPPNRTRGEMDFLNYLSQNGLAVPRPERSLAGNLVEVIEAPSPDLPEGSFFSVVSFDKAPGGPPRKEDWNPELFNKMGRFMGRLHQLSKRYQPSRPEYRRHDWYEDEEDYAIRYLPASEALVTEKFARLVTYLKSLPRDPQGYGLNHVDFHSGNFFVHRDRGVQDGGSGAGSGADSGTQITLFDFDDCAYAPFVYDIAMALFYAVPHHCDTPADLRKARTFYQAFMEGYRLENQLDPAWLKEIPHFLKLREMDLYIVIHRSYDINNLDPWEASFMAGRKERIENDVPYINMEFD